MSHVRRARHALRLGRHALETRDNASHSAKNILDVNRRSGFGCCGCSCGGRYRSGCVGLRHAPEWTAGTGHPRARNVLTLEHGLRGKSSSFTRAWKTPCSLVHVPLEKIVEMAGVHYQYDYV